MKHQTAMAPHYEINLMTFSNADSSGIFKYISHIRKGGAIPPTVFYGSTIATSDSERSTLFHNYFCRVYTKSLCTLSSSAEMPEKSITLSLMKITASDVVKVLMSLDTSKAMGLDEIGRKF